MVSFVFVLESTLQDYKISTVECYKSTEMILSHEYCTFCMTGDADHTADNTLLYLHEVYDILSTDDGSDLDLDCIGKYSTEWESKAAAMMGTINQALVGGLCDEDVASVISYTGAFASLGSQVGMQPLLSPTQGPH